jgi:hypothetical protein
MRQTIVSKGNRCRLGIDAMGEWLGWDKDFQKYKKIAAIPTADAVASAAIRDMRS